MRRVAAASLLLGLACLTLSGCGPDPLVVPEEEPNDYHDQTQVLPSTLPLVVTGWVKRKESTGDGVPRKDARGEWRLVDHIEDLYRIETTERGPILELSGFTGNLDLYVLARHHSDRHQSIAFEGPERIDLSHLPAGTYTFAVSAYDHDPTPDMDSTGSAYRLLIR